jgi:hypothetical protein
MRYKINSYDRWDFEEKVYEETGEWPIKWGGDRNDEIETSDYPFSKLEIDDIARWDFNARRID